MTTHNPAPLSQAIRRGLASDTTDRPAPSASKRRRTTPKRSAADRQARAVERRRLAAERATAVLSGDGYMRLPEVLVVLPVSASAFWAGIREGRFPKGVKLGPRCTAWRAADIRSLLARLGSEGEQ